MVIGIMTIINLVFGEIGDIVIEHLPQIYDVSSFCLQTVTAMGGFKTIALLLLVGFNIGILSLMAYVAFKIA